MRNNSPSKESVGVSRDGTAEDKQGCSMFPCSLSVSTAVLHTITKEAWGAEGLFHLVAQGNYGRNSKQEPASGNWCRGHEGVLLTDVLFMA